MASSGSFRTKGWYSDSKKDYVYLLFEWSIKSQSIANNSTVISWSLKGDRTASGYVKAAPFKVVIDGDTVYSSSTRIELYDGTLVASGTKTLSHKNDGSRSFSASAEGALYSSSVNSTGSGSWSLTAIPRKATITSADDFNDEASPVLKYSNPAGNAATTLQACISLTGAADDIAYRDISKTGSSYTFALTTAERNVLLNACTTAKSRSVKFYVKTIIGGETYYSSVSKTLSIVNAEPTLSPTVTDSNAATVALTGNSATFVKYCSDAAFAFNATALKGATIKSRKLTCGSKSSTSASGTLSAVESGQFIFTVTDSRGYTTEVVLARQLINYVKKTCDLKSASFSVDGTINFTVKGSFFNGSFGAVANALAVEYRYKESGGSYGSWTAAEAKKSGNTYSASVALTGLDYTKKYVIQARITDSVGATTSSTKTLSCLPVFDWGESDISFNVNAHFRNGGLGIRGVTTGGADVQAFAPCNANDNCVVGYGAYAEEVGGTNIYGNDLVLFTKNDARLYDAANDKYHSILGALNAISNVYTLPYTITKGENFSEVTATARLIGNSVRLSINCTRTAAPSVGNITNDLVATIRIKHDGKVSNLYRTGFCSESTGGLAAFAADVSKVDDNYYDILVYLVSTTVASTQWNGYWAMPASIDLAKYV